MSRIDYGPGRRPTGADADTGAHPQFDRLDTIERLEAENKRLRDALAAIANGTRPDPPLMFDTPAAVQLRRKAAEALTGPAVRLPSPTQDDALGRELYSGDPNQPVL